MPHNVREVMISGPGTKYDHFEDITETFGLKLVALKEHKSQMGTDPERLANFEAMVREGYHKIGAEQGMEYAEGFRRIVLR